MVNGSNEDQLLYIIDINTGYAITTFTGKIITVSYDLKYYAIYDYAIPPGTINTMNSINKPIYHDNKIASTRHNINNNQDYGITIFNLANVVVSRYYKVLDETKLGTEDAFGLIENSSHYVLFDSITNKPTTLAGYGITDIDDAVTADHKMEAIKIGIDEFIQDNSIKITKNRQDIT
jgi:hypothetical protein